MLPLSLLVPSKAADLLLAGSAFSEAIAAAARENNLSLPTIKDSEIVVTSAAPDLADSANQLTYPRICLYSAGIKNNHIEKFRAVSGSVSMIADIWSSGNFVGDADRWIHFYVDAFTTILGESIGDWGDGLYFPGTFDVQFQPPKRGGFGFTQVARVSAELSVSR